MRANNIDCQVAGQVNATPPHLADPVLVNRIAKPSTTAQTLLCSPPATIPTARDQRPASLLSQPRTTAVILGAQVPQSTAAALPRTSQQRSTYCWSAGVAAPGRCHALRSVDEARKTLQPSAHIVLVPSNAATFVAVLINIIIIIHHHQNHTSAV